MWSQLASEGPCQPKVGNSDVTIRCDKDVVGFQVAMYNFEFVERLKTEQQLGRDDLELGRGDDRIGEDDVRKGC